MTKKARESEPESYPMPGGDSPYSYAKNSSYQRDGAIAVKAIVDEEIAKSLDVTKLSLISNTFCLADLGCSTGPNTFIQMQHLIESVKIKYPLNKLPQFQVFFSDHASNDFNTLFTSLPGPPERQYFAAGVPGSFHGRLFPESSLHFVNSSYALHWLSQPPQQCVDEDSDAYNKGKIHHFGAPSVVVEAYATQFANDMGAFLEARATEIMSGGMIVMTMAGSPKDVGNAFLPLPRVVRALESILLDMVKMGKMRESEVDSFNIPMYTACPEEMTLAVEKNGNFSIEKVELTYPALVKEYPNDQKASATITRTVFGTLFSKHFGDEMTDELFDLLYVKLKETAPKERIELSRLGKSLLLVVLKRK